MYSKQAQQCSARQKKFPLACMMALIVDFATIGMKLKHDIVMLGG